MVLYFLFNENTRSWSKSALHYIPWPRLLNFDMDFSWLWSLACRPWPQEILVFLFFSFLFFSFLFCLFCFLFFLCSWLLIMCGKWSSSYDDNTIHMIFFLSIIAMDRIENGWMGFALRVVNVNELTRWTERLH